MKPNFFRRISGNRFSANAMITSPLSWIAPSVGLSSAPSIESRVVLPEPDGPIINTTSPGATDMDTARTAVTSVAPAPYRFVTRSTVNVTVFPFGIWSLGFGIFPLFIVSLFIASFSSEHHRRIQPRNLPDGQNGRQPADDQRHRADLDQRCAAHFQRDPQTQSGRNRRHSQREDQPQR